MDSQLSRALTLARQAHRLGQALHSRPVSLGLPPMPRRKLRLLAALLHQLSLHIRGVPANSASGAPPPARMFPSSKAFLTTQSASCRDLSASSTTCSVPPR